MDLGLEKRRALVTGASRGLGRAIALALASEGAEVAAVARNLERLNELAREIPAGPGTIAAHACDLADASAIDGLSSLLQRADILVLNTGGPPPGSAADTPDAMWIKQFESMFLSAIRLTRLALPGMRRRGFAELDRGRAKREGIDLAQVEKESRAVIPAGRYGDAAEFAAVTAFLASPRASYMTGGVIRVDGGMIRSV
jgi:3-oxoacyl-[acyl-carrier protein] reductase